MEEASVAGESPDKSEQQKSSGTARSESDPRLAVFREPPADDAAAGSGETDTATAVFRTDAVAGAGEEAEGAEGAKEAESDTATAVFRAMPSGDGDGAGDAESAGAGEAAEAGDGSRTESADADADGDAGSEGAAGAVSAEEADEAERSGKRADGPEEEPEAAEAPEDADAAEAEAEDAPESADAAEAEAPEGPDAAEGADESGDGDDAAKAAEGSGEGSGEGDARLRAAVAAWVSKDGDEDAESEERAERDDAKADASEDGAADDAEDAEDVTPDATTASSAAEASDDAEEAEETSDADDKASSAEEKKADAEGDDAEGEKGADDKGGIDQPTAIFRAPTAPTAPRVDQPTTALKIPPIEPKPESAAERTSKFVPLRGDDVRPAPAATPAPRKPETPAASAAPAPASLSTAERTTQQPMPPKPPLDLLAELTNTPPPPETPVRTAVRRVKIWTPLVLLLLIAFAIVQMVRPLPEPQLQMSAKDTYTFKGSKPTLPWPDEGQGYMAATGLGPVGSFGEQKAVPIGSVAKAMTAYIVLKDHPLKKGEKGPSIEIDAKAESDGKLDAEGESTLNTVTAGDKLTEQEALSAIMIPSANNIARLLARWDAGSEEAFVKKMNETAKSLGMTNTTYTDPSGLNATTVSSAEDQVKLGQKLVEIPALMEITKLPSWTDPSGKNWRNYNTLVPYNGALGIKTGSTSKAGGNLLFAAHKMVGDTDQLIVGAVLGQHKPAIIDTVNAVSKEVMLATQDLLEGAKVVKKGDVVGTVEDGFGNSVPVVATKDVSAVGWPGLTVRIELTDDGKTIPNSAAAGTHVGTLTVGEGTSQVKVAVALQSDLTEPAFGDKLTRIG
ncbi:D-alanyl-D-alanine carboxypeptidase [Streptomyces sp. NPDC056255]|uniref:D-alanyl-D-alanine carboxypeptidase n=1 Tax=Streptomyces sp. NPDC056255 TaxID=3345764 RepID=UPI0035D844CD